MGDEFLDALLDEMVANEAKASNAGRASDMNYLDLLSEMVGDSKQDDVADSAIDDLLDSMVADSKRGASTAKVNPAYDDVLDDLLADSTKTVTAADLDNTLKDMEEDYDSLMNELMGSAKPSTAPAPYKPSAAPPPGEYNDLLDELMSDLTAPTPKRVSAPKPVAAAPKAAAKPAPAPSSADDLMDELMNDLTSGSKPSASKPASKSDAATDSLLDELLGEVSKPAAAAPASKPAPKAAPAADPDDLMNQLLAEVSAEVTKPAAKPAAQPAQTKPPPSFVSDDQMESALRESIKVDPDMLNQLLNQTESRPAPSSGGASSGMDGMLEDMISSFADRRSSRVSRPAGLSAPVGDDLLDAMLSEVQAPVKKVQPSVQPGAEDDLLDAMISSFAGPASTGSFLSPIEKAVQEQELAASTERNAQLESQIRRAEEAKRIELENYQRQQAVDAERQLILAQQQEEHRKRQELQRLEMERFKEAQRRAAELKAREEAERRRSEADLSEFNFGELLGHGSWGTTYRGGNFRDRGAVQLKKILCNRLNDGWIANFRQECRKLHNLDHINLVKFQAGAVNDEVFVIAQEYIRGADLFTFLRNVPRQAELDPVVTQIAREIAHGMAFLHANKVTHRDLKSSNIFLTGRERSVKIGDYGFTEFKDNLHNIGAVCSPEYNAPELYDTTGRGRQFDYDERVDVYAFGIVLWELFSREVPWAGVNPVDIPVEMRQGKRPPILPTMPAPIVKLIQRCWSVDRNQRPTFADIEAILDQPFDQLLVYEQKVRPSVPVAKVDQLDAATKTKLAQIVESIRTLLKLPDAFNQQKGLKAMFDVAHREPQAAYREFLGESKLAGELTATLASSDLETRMQALRILLPMSEVASFAIDFGRNAGMASLQPSLASNDLRFNLAAVKCLSILAKVETNAGLVGPAKLMPPLIKLLQTRNQFVVTETCHALSLILRQVANQELFSQEGGLEFLLALQSDDNPAMQIRVLETLKWLVLNDKMKLEVLSTNVLRRFVNLLSSKAPLLQSMAVKAVNGFLKDDIILTRLATDAQVVPGLLSALGSKDEKVKERALNSLSSFIDNPANADTFVRNKGVQFAMVLMKSKKPEVQQQALLVLANTLQHCPPARQQFFVTGGVPTLVELLKSGDEKKKKPALFIIANVANDVNTWDTLAQSGAIGTLTELAGEHQDEATRVRALQALALISGEKNSHKVFSSEGAAIFPLIASSLKDPNLGTGFHDFSLRLVANVASSEACVELIDEASLIPLVVARLADKSKLLRSVALKAVLVLARGGKVGAQLKAADAKSELDQLTKVPDDNIKMAAQKALEFLR